MRALKNSQSILFACLLLASAASGSAQTIAGRASPPAANAAAQATSSKSFFLAEMDFSVQALNTLAPPPLPASAAGPSNQVALSPEAALIYMTALAASPGTAREHAARQVLLEYSARPGIRDEIEAAFRYDAATTLAELKTLRSKIEGFDNAQRRAFLDGLIVLRRKLYVSTRKQAVLDGTREHLTRFFDDSAATQPSETRNLKTASIDLAPADEAADAKATEEIASVIKTVVKRHIDPITPIKLLTGLTQTASIDGAVPGFTDGTKHRRDILSQIAADLRRTMDPATFESTRGSEEVLQAFLRLGIAPARTPKDFFRLVKAVVSRADVYSRFLDPEDLRQRALSLKSEYGGIGITMDGSRLARRGAVFIRSVNPGSPAEASGLKPGDIIAAVDGKSMNVFKDLDSIQGKPGTQVTLTVQRDGIIFTAIATRRILPAPPHVFGSMLPGRPGVGYLAFKAFLPTTAYLVGEQLRTLRESGMKTLVLDVRFNPGGDIAAAEKIAKFFLRENQVVAHYARRPRTTSTVASVNGEFADLPIVLLTNRKSISASEILSSALQDNGRALIVGEQTFGKNVGQDIKPLTLRGEATTLIVTAVRWLTPSKRSIHPGVSGQNGVKPDVPLVATRDENENAVLSFHHAASADGKWNPYSDPWIVKAAELAEARLR